MEYRIIKDVVSVCEDRLNKWSKEYNINIIQMCTVKEGLIILMTVTPKVQFPDRI